MGCHTIASEALRYELLGELKSYKNRGTFTLNSSVGSPLLHSHTPHKQTTFLPTSHSHQTQTFTMQFKVIALFTTLATSVLATPTPAPQPFELAIRDVLEKRGCSWGSKPSFLIPSPYKSSQIFSSISECVTSLAPSVASCAGAAAEEGASMSSFASLRLVLMQ